MTADDLAALNDQIAAMARAGLPLDQGLESLAREMGRGQLRAVTQELANDLRAGFPLSEALARQAGRIPPYYANLVTAGVQTGKLPEVLTTLTTYAKSVAATRATVIEALFYPSVVLFIGLALFTGLALFILPEFDQIFRDFGMRLPPLTECVLMFGRNPIEIIFIPAATVIAALVFLWVWARRTTRGRRVCAKAIYLLPMIGPLMRSARLAAFTDLLSMLVDYGVPLPTAFRLAGAASSDPAMAVQAGEIAEQLEQGVPLGGAFHDKGLVPAWVAWLAAAGESRNALAPALREIAAIYRRQVDNRSAILRSVLPPLVVILTAGVLTFVFAITIMYSMIKLLEGLSN